MAVSGIILVGGGSRRMGQDKALLALSGQRLIDRVADLLGGVADDLLVVGSDVERYRSAHWRVVPDAFPGAGSLGGLYSGLQAARYPYAVAVAVDMPFLNPDLLSYLIRVGRDWDATVPRVNPFRLSAQPGRDGHAPTARDADLQPLHAVYHRRIAAAIRTCIRQGDLRMISFLPLVRVRLVTGEETARYDPEGLSFFNANTPDDWRAVQERLND